MPKNQKEKKIRIEKYFICVLLCLNLATLAFKFGSSSPSDNENTGLLTIGDNFYRDSYRWDPILNSYYGEHIYTQILENLFKNVLIDGVYVVEPCLASNFGFFNQDCTNFTLEIKQNIDFSNGMSLNAEVVKWNFDRWTFLQENSSDYFDRYVIPFLYRNGTRILKDIIIQNDFTITFQMNFPFSGFRFLLAYLPLGIIAPENSLERNYIFSQDGLVGTGPYKLVNLGSDDINLVANQKYWGNSVYFNRIKIKSYYYDGMNLTQDFLQGKIDIVSGTHTDWYSKELDSYDGWWESSSYFSNFKIGLRLNINQIPIIIRKAISFSLDENLILPAIGMNLERSDSLLFPFMDECSSEENKNFNLTHARQILIENNYSQGLNEHSSEKDWINIAESTMPLCDFTIPTISSSDLQPDDKLPFLIKANLQKIGIKVEILNMGYYTYINYLNDSTSPWGIIQYGINMENGDIVTAFEDVFQFSDYPILRNSDAQVNNYIDEINKESNLTVRSSLIISLSQYIDEEIVPFALFYGQTYHFGFSTRINTPPSNNYGILYYADATGSALGIQIFDESIKSFPNILGISILITEILFISIYSKRKY